MRRSYPQFLREASIDHVTPTLRRGVAGFKSHIAGGKGHSPFKTETGVGMKLVSHKALRAIGGRKGTLAAYHPHENTVYGDEQKLSKSRGDKNSFDTTIGHELLHAQDPHVSRDRKSVANVKYANAEIGSTKNRNNVEKRLYAAGVRDKKVVGYVDYFSNPVERHAYSGSMGTFGMERAKKAGETKSAVKDMIRRQDPRKLKRAAVMDFSGVEHVRQVKKGVKGFSADMIHKEGKDRSLTPQQRRKNAKHLIRTEKNMNRAMKRTTVKYGKELFKGFSKTYGDSSSAPSKITTQKNSGGHKALDNIMKSRQARKSRAGSFLPEQALYYSEVDNMFTREELIEGILKKIFSSGKNYNQKAKKGRDWVGGYESSVTGPVWKEKYRKINPEKHVKKGSGYVYKNPKYKNWREDVKK